MPNPYFQFKQFTVHQDKCAMKVTTDGCLFGAVAASLCAPHDDTSANVLDVGTGTGLLSLMYAQQNKTAQIDAIEIDKPAAMQAVENFAASPWADRLQVTCVSLQQFITSKHYDIIVTNPPFYEKQLVSGNGKKDLAHHGTDLSLKVLVELTTSLLTANGRLVMLLPHYREDEALQLVLANGLQPSCTIRVRQTPKHNYFRSILVVQAAATYIRRQEIIIKTDDRYSTDFEALLKPYYLNLL